MLMFIIGMSLLFSYVMSYLHISQSLAQWIVALAALALGAAGGHARCSWSCSASSCRR